MKRNSFNTIPLSLSLVYQLKSTTLSSETTPPWVRVIQEKKVKWTRSTYRMDRRRCRLTIRFRQGISWKHGKRKGSARGPEPFSSFPDTGTRPCPPSTSLTAATTPSMISMASPNTCTRYYKHIFYVIYAHQFYFDYSPSFVLGLWRAFMGCVFFFFSFSSVPKTKKKILNSF